jgi:NADP-dependent 3-hydroxy acid dehydrogenase YdfG
MSKPEVPLIVGDGPGISASCATLVTQQGVKVAITARDANTDQGPNQP